MTNTPSPTPATGQAVTPANPFAGARWYIDPASNAQRQADAWRASRPADAAAMDKIAGQPQADWWGEWAGDIQKAVAARVATITAAGALPLFVVYNIPNRDCGQYSAGGAADPAAYQAWIRDFAAGLGAARAVIVLEPDALGLLTECLAPADQQARLALLAEAVRTLKAQSGTAVYLDGGHSRWLAPPVLAERLTAAGIAAADGFALNTSNYMATDTEVAYGKSVAALVGGKHFIIDTSRNGRGPTADFQWCNPPDRALGPPPTTATADPLVDAYVWIKRPGESDGACNGGPTAGAWWPAAALGLAQRADW